MRVCTKCGESKPHSAYYVRDKSTGRLYSQCKPCCNARSQAWMRENVAKATEMARRSRERHSERYRAYLAATREARNARSLKWAKDNPERHLEKVRRYQAARLQRMPRWARGLDFLSIYETARRLTIELGTAHEVDHIVPLRGETVSGLHVPWNLQVLPTVLNRSKHNRWEV